MRKALIVWGGWQGHDPDLCASIIREWLKKEGFEVRVETTTAAFADPAIHDLSLIIPMYTMSKIEKAEALTAALEAKAAGDKVVLAIVRDTVEHLITIDLGEGF